MATHLQRRLIVGAALGLSAGVLWLIMMFYAHLTSGEQMFVGGFAGSRRSPDDWLRRHDLACDGGAAQSTSR
jgi:hypothetical protein